MTQFQPERPPYELVVFGATSFVGQILCRYLLDTYGVNGDLRWAAAGRSETKLALLRSELGDAALELPLLTADSHDQDSLTALCAQTRVVISTVGPYALYGEPLVAACVDSGTHYCDLTGEPQWIRAMIEQYQARADASGARLVHCCGFDSIPSDLGVWFLQQEAQRRWQGPASHVAMRVKAAKGGLSGGTFASMMNLLKEASQSARLRKELANPYAFCPTDHPFHVRQFNPKGASFDAHSQRWVAPFIMAAINTRVVHRSNALAGNAYGTDFHYDEAMMMGRGLAGRTRAMTFSAALLALTLGGSIGPVRGLMQRFLLPKPGEGPSPAAQQRGFFDLRFYGRGGDGQRLEVKVTGDRDPGYGSTAKMLGEAAFCLARHTDDLPGGFWTPATALGAPLVERLQQQAGLTFEVLTD